MNVKERMLLESWLLWSTSYYLYIPFLSIYLSSFIPELKLSLLYAGVQAISLPYPIIGARLSKKNKIFPIVIGMSLSGLGLILLVISKNLYEALIFMAINYLFYLSLPSYYSLMAEIGEGIITKVWSLSIIPSIIMPSVGGIIAQYFGLRVLFILSGFLLSLSFLPLLNLNISNFTNDNFKLRFTLGTLIVIIIILPIAMASPYIYLVIYKHFNLTKEQVGFIATLAEILGMLLSLFSSKFISKKKYLLSFSLFVFSLIIFYNFSPFVAIFFGSWEAIIPLTLEYFPSNRKNPEDFAIINVMQGIGWVSGYLLDYSFNNVKLLLISSSVIAFLSACIILIKK